MKTTYLTLSRAVCIFLLTLSIGKQSHAQICSVNAGLDKTICVNQQPLALSGSIGNPQSSEPIYSWTKIAGPPASITNPAALTTAVTGMTPGNYIFELSNKCVDGLFAKDYLSITVLPDPSTALAGPDRSMCFNDSIRLSGNAVGAGLTGTWTVYPPGGTFTPNANAPDAVFYSAPRAGTRKFTWAISNGACKKSDFMFVNFAEPVVPVSAGPDDTLSCKGNCTVLKGSYQGYHPQSGAWTVISGPNVPIFSNRSSATSKICGLIPGIYVLRWSVTGACMTGSDEMILNVENIKNPPASLGDQVYTTTCETPLVSSEVLIGAPLAPGDTATWTQISGPATATYSPNNHVSSVLVENLTGTFPYKFSYTHSSSSGCTMVTAHTVYRSQPITGLTNPPDQRLDCDVTSTTFDISFNKLNTISNSLVRRPVFVSGPIDTGRVEMISSTVAGMIRTDTWEVSDLETPGTYVYQFEYSNACGIFTQDISITVSRTPGIVNAGSDITLPCHGFEVTPVGSVNSPGVFTWSQISGPSSAVITGENTLVPALTDLVEGVYIIRLRNWGGDACPLKIDDMPVMVTNLPPVMPVIGSDTSICAGNFQLQAQSVLLTETGTWSVTPSTGISFYPGPNIPTAFVSGLLPNSSYTFTWTLTNVCGTVSAQRTLTTGAFYSAPVPDAGADECLAEGTGSVLLTGNAANSANIQWTALTAGSTINPANTQSALASFTGGSGTYMFTYSLGTNGCATFLDTVRVNIRSNIFVNAGPDRNICTDSTMMSTTLAASTSASGSGNPGGSWRMISGPANPIWISPTELETEIQNLPPGTYEFEYRIPFPIECGSIADTVVINVLLQPSIANAGADQAICSILPSSVISLSAATPQNGTGYWQVLNGPTGSESPVFSDQNSGSSDISNLTNGSYTLLWTVTNGTGCTPSSDQMILDVNAAADAGPDMHSCSVANITLTGSPNTSGTWSIVSTGPGTTITPISGNSVVVSGQIPGDEPDVSTFQYSLPAAGLCPASIDEITFTNYPSPSPADAGPDKILCFDQTTVTLSGNIPAVGRGSWFLMNGPNSPTPGLANNSSIDTVVQNLLPGVYLYEFRISTGPACVTSIENMQVVKQESATAMADVRLCNSSTVDLIANVPQFGFGSWSYVTGPLPSMAVLIANPQEAATTVSGLVPGTYTFRWSLPDSGNCVSSQDNVQVIIDPPVPVMNAGSDTVFCQGTVSAFELGEPSVSGVNYTWTPTLMLINPGVSQPVFLGTNNPGNYFYTVKSYIGSCEVFATVNIHVKPAPIANIEILDGSCAAVMIASAPGAGVINPVYSWNIVGSAGPSAFSGPGPHNIQYNSSTNSTISLDISSSDGCSSSTTIDFTPMCLVPVTLLSFDAAWKNSVAELSWRVENAERFSHFELQRSDDRISFSRIHTTSYEDGVSEYRYHDRDLAGKSASEIFYRLKLIDQDGNFKYSEIRVLKLRPQFAETVVSPNPFTDHINIYYTARSPERLQITIYDASGHAMQKYERPVTNGRNTIQLMNLGALSPGLYTTRILSDHGNISNHKLLKIK